ncbi:MAG: hypothetical protein AAFW60_07970 [Pseudomonadota bacterium]
MTKKHEPTDEERGIVLGMSAVGVPQDQIAAAIGIDAKTLRLHYRDDIDKAVAKANANVANNLYKKATGDGKDSVTAAIFWCKTRLGWKDTTAVELTGKNGGPLRTEPATIDVSKLSTEALKELRLARLENNDEPH